MLKFLKLWPPVFAWCGFIFYLSSLPNLGTGWGYWDLILRKFAHMLEYFILAALLYRAFKGSFKFPAFHLTVWPLLLTFLYAVSDEVHQAFVPTRGPSIQDVLVDSAGIILFYIFIRNKAGAENVD
ncbi:MAG: VanZ family protein [Candidatus Omnitrophica bacterium]|nr:VanZ family protein [Candidatus Omnitrophota bacterium]MDD5552380.1 VanZ family protein [Candidatus Omnitrophota bacterium]